MQINGCRRRERISSLSPDPGNPYTEGACVMNFFRASLIAALLSAVFFITGCNCPRHTADWYFLKDSQLTENAWNESHFDRFGQDAPDYNKMILQGIDKVQSTAPDGGGYFIGLKAVPAESPIGYPLHFGGGSLIDPPRGTSYCSGSSYAAFIEGLNLIFQNRQNELSSDRLEALRMQEPDGGRREDGIKFWGQWNADGFGSEFALVQYSGMGKEVSPREARPGDFMNISWKHGGGHSVIFLGWYGDSDTTRQLLYWSSQKGTHGLGEQLVKCSRIHNVKIVRLTNPEALFSFDPATPVNPHVPGDSLDFSK